MYQMLSHELHKLTLSASNVNLTSAATISNMSVGSCRLFHSSAKKDFSGTASNLCTQQKASIGNPRPARYPQTIDDAAAQSWTCTRNIDRHGPVDAEGRLPPLHRRAACDSQVDALAGVRVQGFRQALHAAVHLLNLRCILVLWVQRQQQ